MGHLNNEYSAHLMCEVIGEKNKKKSYWHTYLKKLIQKELALATYQQVFQEEQIAFSNIKVASQIDIVSGGNYEN